MARTAALGLVGVDRSPLRVRRVLVRDRSHLLRVRNLEGLRRLPRHLSTFNPGDRTERVPVTARNLGDGLLASKSDIFDAYGASDRD